MATKVNFDFHCHCAPYSECATQNIDGLIEQLLDNGITHVAITNHDTVLDLDFLKRKCSEKHITLFSGIEFSTQINNIGKSGELFPHILGIHLKSNFDLVEKRLKKCTEFNAKNRVLKNEFYSSIFNVSIPSDYGKRKVIALLEKNGISKEKFKKVYNDPTFMERYKHMYIDVKNAIDTIHDMGGIAILAHPFKSKNNTIDEEDTLDLINACIALGIDGIEVMHPHTCMNNKTQFLYDIAIKNHLAYTIGSDKHHKDNEPYFKYDFDGYVNILDEIITNDYWINFKK